MYKLEAVYREAKETYEKAIADPNVQEMIRIQEKAEMDYKDALAHAMDNGREEGKAEGIKEGIKEGREEGERIGEARGIEKGREEGKAKGACEKAMETARAMLKDNVSVDMVSKYTGLSIEEISKLQR